MRVAIEAIEYALPERIVTNADLERENPGWNMARLLERTGVEERRIAAAGETALDLGYRACLALDAAGVLDPGAIDGLIFCTETPDYPLPPNSSLLHARLNLSPNVMAFDITLACSGFVYALGIARSLIISATCKRVLIVTADTYSRLIHPGDRASRCLFGDGGAAVIVASGPGVEIVDIDCKSAGAHYDRFIVRAGAARVPRSAETAAATVDRSGNVRTAEHIVMDGLGVLSFFNTVVPQ
jgi:3-oxoacyl-[acyl-carrier-protein] synthase-3